MPLSSIFFNPVKRLRSGWRFLIFCFLFVALTFVLLAAVGAIFQLFGLLERANDDSPALFALQFFAVLPAAILVGWLCANKIENLPFKSLGWSFDGARWLRDLTLGFALGAASLLLAALVVMICGDLRFAFNQTASQTAILNTIFASLAVFALGAASEEAMFRGYALQTFARARLVWVAILLTSAFFAVAHIGNPNVTVFGLLNTALAGIWFVAAYLKTRNLWFPFGLHWAWNWTMGAILGIPVSGIERLTPAPLLNSFDNSPTWLSGGHYGLEGGAACTAALIISTVFIWFAPFLKPTPEMLALTNRENPKTQNSEMTTIFNQTETAVSTDDVGDFKR